MAQSWTVGGEYALLCGIWGSTWIVILVGMEGVSPFLGASLRFALAVAALVPIALVTGRKFPRARVELGLVAFVGVVLFGMDYGLIYWGEANGVPSGLSAVLFATFPLQTALVAHVFLPSERLTLPKVAGILAGLAGLALIFRGQLGAAGLSIALPMAAIVVSAACASFPSVFTKRWGPHVDPITFNAGAMAIGSGVLGAASVLSGERLAWPAWPVGVLSIVYLSLLGSVVSFVTYISLLKRIEVSALAFVAMITPLVALFLGFAFRAEQIGVLELAGTALTLGGVYVSTQVGHAPNPEPGPAAPVPRDPPSGSS